MDTKTLIQTLGKNLGQDQRTVTAMLEAVASTLASSAGSLTDVAIPSFGTFSPTKVDEEIVTDHVTGKRMLLPPQVSIKFIPAAMLRKKMIDSHE